MKEQYKCQAVSSGMNPVQRAAAEIISLDMTTVEPSVLAAVITKGQPMPLCGVWEGRPKTIGEVVSQCRTMWGMTSEQPQSNGSDVMAWTYQQLSGTDWSGAPAASNSSSNSGTVGKPGTSEDGGSKSSESATPAGMSTNASTFTEMDDDQEEQERLERMYDL